VAAAASLTACIHLPFLEPAAAPEPPAVDAGNSEASAAAEPAEIDAGKPKSAGLPAHGLDVDGTLVVRRESVRSIPELRSTRLGPVVSVSSPSPLFALSTAISNALGGWNAEPGFADDDTEASEEDADSEVSSANERPNPDALPRGTMVLHVGDSFAGALGVPLGKRLKARGLRSVLQFKKASYITNWAFGDQLRIHIARHKPDLVLVSLGANEIELQRPTQRVYAIRRLVETMGTRPCVWISPPMWKPDAGLLAVIRENIAPCRYLDSDALVPHLERGPDRIHPSRRGREVWADAVLAWLSKERDPQGHQPWQLRGTGQAESAARYPGGFPARQPAQP
jgi:hypothetical protein